MSWFSKSFGKTSRTGTQNQATAQLPLGHIGVLGDIIFEVSSESVMTFRDFSRKIGVSLATHKVIGAKPIVEYLAPDLQSITFKIQLHGDLGINPLVEMDRIEKMCEAGEINHLIIGDTVIGDNQWIIESISEDETIYLPSGEILYTELTLSLKEYI